MRTTRKAIGWTVMMLLAALLRADESAAVVGETVYVHLSATADVTAVMRFEDWIGDAAPEIRMPVFAHAQDDPVAALDASGLEIDLNGKRADPVAPCPPPEGFTNVMAGRRVFWFRADVAETLAGETPTHGLEVRVRYTQSLINGRFYFLPIIPGQADGMMGHRAWAWQLIARSDRKVPKLAGTDPDREQLRDLVVVYLRHGQVVEIDR